MQNRQNRQRPGSTAGRPGTAGRRDTRGNGRSTPQGVRPRTPKPYQTRAKQLRRQQTKAVSGLAVALVAAIFVSAALLITQNIDWDVIFADKNYAPFANPDGLLWGPEITKEERDAFITQYVTVPHDRLYRGTCILVNRDIPYHFTEDEDDLISIYKNKTKGYKVRSGSEYLKTEAVYALNNMMDAFYAETENNSIMVNSSYRSEKSQKALYEENLAAKGKEYADAYVQQPGYSEHHTGYAMDLAVYEEYEDGTSAMWAFDGKDEYFWIDRNCEQYGFVLRYSASKEDVTNIKYESWHYRYVGVGNALAMDNMALALEEYISFIKDYRWGETLYYVTAENGDQYALYYVPAEGTDKQEIPLPRIALDYNISGNNLDGFIVSALIAMGDRS